MNTRVAGHTYPDMYGAVIHANIISMILQDKFIYCVPFYFECLFAFTITFLVLLVVVHLYGKDYESYETIVVIIQYISAGLLLFIYFILFAKARVSFNMTLPIIGMISLQLGVNTYHSLIKFLKRFIHLKFLKSW